MSWAIRRIPRYLLIGALAGGVTGVAIMHWLPHTPTITIAVAITVLAAGLALLADWPDDPLWH